MDGLKRHIQILKEEPKLKILVTGANGYLGQGIVRSILNNGHCVVATDFNTQFVDERAERIACNLFEVDNPYSFFGEPDVLLHLAWRDGFRLGTFQLSDIFYNTVGGVLGGLMYCAVMKVRKRL